jgi:hypothetical protein
MFVQSVRGSLIPIYPFTPRTLSPLSYKQILRNYYTLSKFLKIGIEDARKMPMVIMRYYMEELGKDVNNKDPILIPQRLM